ncbi:hypothetical protein TWF281_002148 [Arthrobotrys megalospora]
MASTDKYRHYWTDETTVEITEAFERELHQYAKRTSGSKSLSAATVRNELFHEVSLKEVENPEDLKDMMISQWRELKIAVRGVSESFFHFYSEKPPGAYFNELSKEDRFRISNAISELKEYRLGGVVSKKYTRWLWDNRMKTVRSAQPRAEEQLNVGRSSDVLEQGGAGQQLNMEQTMLWQSDLWRYEMEEEELESCTLPPLRGRHPHAGGRYQTR